MYLQLCPVGSWPTAALPAAKSLPLPLVVAGLFLRARIGCSHTAASSTSFTEQVDVKGELAGLPSSKRTIRVQSR